MIAAFEVSKRASVQAAINSASLYTIYSRVPPLPVAVILSLFSSAPVPSEIVIFVPGIILSIKYPAAGSAASNFTFSSVLAGISGFPGM